MKFSAIEQAATKSRHGKVFLIGAGPGDVELLTLKAVKALGASDVVLIDDLVNREVLDFTRPGVRVVEVGKRGGCRSTPQAFIERRMIHEAKSGHAVARLKGGDPFIFGRGGEEWQALIAAGVEVEIVNGITAGIGVPAALGIPLTHRHFCHGVTFITGHTPSAAGIDWQALAKSKTTLVIYMGMSHLPAIVDALCQAGMARATPACAIQNGTLATQQSVVATLVTLCGAVTNAGMASPAIIVVGEVVGLAKQLPLENAVTMFA